MLYEPVALGNSLVDSLSERARDQLQLTLVAQGTVLVEAGEKPRYVYFPAGCVASLMHAMEDGSMAEVSVVGHDGMVGLELFLSGGPASGRAVVHCGGYAYRLRAALFINEVERNRELHRCLLRYLQSLITQMAQTAACNRHHSVDQQLCRWLLLSLDRSHSPLVVMTHEMIANMLGVRREGVTEAACRLQKRGVIAYTRGRIEILDREQLSTSSCECYHVIRRSSEHLLDATPTYPAPRVPAHEPARMVA